jgi:putative flippase GtrA
MLGWRRSSRLGVRLGRYTLGSVVAIVTSEVVLIVCYGTGLLGTTASSAVAFVAGAIPNYVLNRSWAFGRRGKVRVGREVVLYVITSLVSFAAAALATGWASHWAKQSHDSHLVRIGVVAAAYLASYGVLFIAKFVVFQVYIFADSPADAARTSGAAGASPEEGGAVTSGATAPAGSAAAPGAADQGDD